jgi:hypothetical protein
LDEFFRTAEPLRFFVQIDRHTKVGAADFDWKLMQPETRYKGWIAVAKIPDIDSDSVNGQLR